MKAAAVAVYRAPLPFGAAISLLPMAVVVAGLQVSRRRGELA